MATLMSYSTGNFTASSWETCDSTTELDSEAGTTNITTTNSDSSTFTPGAITVDALAIKISTTVTPTGTFTATLRNSTDATNVTSVTVNCSDLPANGWANFKFGSSQLLTAGKAYLVRLTRSVADGASNRVQVYRDGTAANHSRQLRTTTTASPAAGDKLIVIGELTGTGTSNSYTITMDQTATTDYGTSSTTVPSLYISQKGTLKNGTAASTNYNLKVSGIIRVESQGEWDLGTVATALPATSTVTVLLDCASNVDFGIDVKDGGTFIAQGASKTAYTTMTADKVATNTVIAVGDTTGWAGTDTVVISATSQTGSQTESKTISTVDSATQITLTAGLTNNHSGTSPTQAEVGNITRNVKIQGASSSLQAYINFQAAATVDWDYVEVFYIGSGSTGKRGITLLTTSSGNVNINGCSIHDYAVTSSIGILANSASNDKYTIANTVFFSNTSTTGVVGFQNVTTTGTSYTLNNLLFIGSASNGGCVSAADVGGTYTNIIAAGNSGAGTAITITENPGTIGTISGITAHSNGSTGVSIQGNGTVSTIISYRNGGAGLSCGNSETYYDGVTVFGNTNMNISMSSSNGVTLNNVTSNGDTSFSTADGIRLPTASFTELRILNSDFSTVTGIKTAHTNDININTASICAVIHIENTKLGASTEVANQTSMATKYSYISSMKHDQNAGSFKQWKRYGTISVDTTIYDVSPSMRLTPNNASNKLEAICARHSAANGTTTTVTVKVRESVVGDGTAYNGNRIRLLVKRNAAAGITSDTVLATATVSSSGAWETLSGTTASVTDDCVLEFAVDCDGTTGWVNADTVTFSPVLSSLGMKYWMDGLPRTHGDNATGGGSSVFVGIVGS